MKRLATVVGLSALLGFAFAAEKVQITFWHAFGGGRTAFIQRAVEDFNYTHPGIEVKVEYKGSYRDTLNAAILAAKQGNAPHIVQIFEVGSQLALDSGIFVPIENYVPADLKFQLDDYIKPVANYYRIGGKFNSIPWNSSNPILYYNKDIFKKAGLDPENPPKTFNEVAQACEKIIASKAAPKCITWPLHSWFVEQWIAEQGALLANNENGRAARATDVYIDSEAMKRIMKWWKGLYDKGYYTYTGKPEDWDGANQLFVSQQAAMEITSTSDVTFMQNASFENGFELGTGFLPVPDGVERNGTVVGGASLWLTKGHPQKEQEAALTFLLWFTNTENMVRWHKGTGYFPVLNTSVKVLEWQNWFERNPAYRAAFDQLLQSKANRATQGALIGPFPEIRTIIENMVQEIFQGKDIAKALSEADAQADQALKRYNASVKK
ncbi:ABC transporter substrate-binding protein [Oceanithermus profundus]|uniref:Extracellular solute-binding protein family 1 n=1 Tax=Oceanithermus profundus (strain DSM 14977 / NBRC 100410 / VKM B-2274 / 506) TaxID=670487 RepID=E4U6T4_OCEP5|nr:ABC transporter substrate-binding protein [Oceanithermus profundus]ADR35878.1 extracellular solute-binding protein family 1 [Oceanithermus profundus DSM 14977]